MYTSIALLDNKCFVSKTRMLQDSSCTLFGIYQYYYVCAGDVAMGVLLLNEELLPVQSKALMFCMIASSKPGSAEELACTLLSCMQSGLSRTAQHLLLKLASTDVSIAHKVSCCC
jgi:hypothetical protein